MAREDWEYRVRHRAYELWTRAGRPDGKHLQFWEVAEQELKRETAAQQPVETNGRGPADAPADQH